MARLPRTLGLAKSYRFIVRATYPARPELADEITSAWFIWPKTKSEDEIRAAKNARKLLEDSIAKERIRLCGVSDGSLPRHKVNPADARKGKLDIFNEQLVISRYGRGVVRRYREVECYETDLHHELKPITPKITNVMIDHHVLVDPKLGIDSKMAHPTQDACVKAWEVKHGLAARDRVRTRYNTHAKNRGIPVKRGPRSNSAK